VDKNRNDGKKVAAITGGARGIGLAVARGFASEGYSIALIDVKEDTLAKAATDPAFAEVEVIGIVSDVSDAKDCESAMQQVLDKLGRVDVLVNNAGVGFHSPLDKLSVEDIDNVLDVNTRGPILLTRAIVPHMIKRGSGSIINISSASAKIGAANLAPYSASKAALVGFTRALAIELATEGIRVNAVCPGITNTAMMANNIRQTMEEKGMSYETALAEWVRIMPTNEMIEPEDVADAVLFLASNRARRITGEALNVSAGVVMW
jgi:meso-butanediol dehydrogenase/(S,S)-butanediol dehydrogenase/diacetyl reductase